MDNRTLLDDVRFGFVDRRTPAEKILNPRLISNEKPDTMHRAIRDELRRAQSFSFSVAFISASALALLKEDLLEFVARGGRGEIITSNYLDFNEPTMFRELLGLDGIAVYVHDDEHGGFHPKGYVFHDPGEVTAIVGSANLTPHALIHNREWNLKFSTSYDGDIALQLEDAVRLQRTRGTLLTEEWIARYEQTRRTRVLITPEAAPTAATEEEHIVANAMQREALDGIGKLRQAGEKKALIISATGTGKTILAALAVKEMAPRRVLFIAHRGEILSKSRTEFQRVLGGADNDYGLLVGGHNDGDARYVFASVQSLNSRDAYRQFAPDAFDVIVVDEVHRGAATTYRTLIDYFRPGFLLGLTATPERTDGGNIFELFDYNVPYEIRLQAALDNDMLAPFHYYGVTDYETEDGELIEDTTQLSRLVSHERLAHILRTLETYGHAENVRGLIFCSRVEEAVELSNGLNQSKINGHLLTTVALSGKDSPEVRDAALRRLNAGELDYILTVDIFNEGVDIPSVNQVVMMRNTQSSIIFTQQLGRGLRKAAGKDHLRVIDFIGNYTNNYLIPVALFGDNSRNKDSIRKQIIDAAEDNTISGVSSVNFTKVARQRIFASLAVARIDGVAEFKKDIAALQSRLGRVPRLLDFARFDTADPYVLATRRTDHYWDLLVKAKLADAPSPRASEFLKFLSRELLHGKAPQELLLLQRVLARGPCSVAEFTHILEAHHAAHSPADLSVVERVLSLEFFTEGAYKLEGVVTLADGVYRLDPTFIETYRSNLEFRTHVDDVIETGLFLSREGGFTGGELKVGNKYSRKDVSRLLRLESNQEGTLNGYKVDKYSATIPIFVNYHKAEDVDASIAYEDKFLDTGTMKWFTRSNRTLRSGEVRDILADELPIHLFVRRDDTEGRDFYYLGLVHPSQPEQTTMPQTGQPVVTMHLKLATPLSEEFLSYLQSTP